MVVIDAFARLLCEVGKVSPGRLGRVLWLVGLEELLLDDVPVG